MLKQNLLHVLKNTYKFQEVSLNKLYKYFNEYSKDSTLMKITEGYIADEKGIKVFIKDASSENYLLPDELKKYDLIILQFVEDKLIASFYREEYGECKEIIDLIESYKKAM